MSAVDSAADRARSGRAQGRAWGARSVGAPRPWAAARRRPRDAVRTPDAPRARARDRAVIAGALPRRSGAGA
jgi:hypothetical protein